MAKTIGIDDVACFAVRSAAPVVTIASTFHPDELGRDLDKATVR